MHIEDDVQCVGTQCQRTGWSEGWSEDMAARCLSPVSGIESSVAVSPAVGALISA